MQFNKGLQDIIKVKKTFSIWQSISKCQTHLACSRNLTKRNTVSSLNLQLVYSLNIWFFIHFSSLNTNCIS